MTEKIFRILKTVLKVILIGIPVLFLLYIAIGIGTSITYNEFFNGVESHGNMPGITDGFVQQGLDSYEDGFFVSGYMMNKSASRVYYIDGEGGTPKVTQLKKADGEDFTGHAGGVAHSGDYLYIAGSKGLYVFKLSDFTGGGGEARQIGFFPTGLNAAWVSVYDGYIFTGSFWEEPDYTTADWQHVTTPLGEENHSMITVFRLDQYAEFGIAEGAVAAISTKGRVQGAAFTNRGIVLSTSLGLNSSVFYFHTVRSETDYEICIEGNGDPVPLYYLDNNTLRKEISSIPMAEEIEIVDGRLYVANESASLKYIFGLLISGNRFYSIPIKDEYFFYGI